MLELVTFGAISLGSTDGRRTIDLLRYPKQLALLAYLAVEARPVTRDELIGLFWPDVTEHRARQSLSRAVSSLHGVIGVKAIVTDGSTARHIASDIVRSDTAAFEAAVVAKQWSEAATIYRGEFLKGFLLTDAREFEAWTSRIRERYRRAAAGALESHADQLGAAGDTLEAANVLARACEIAPEREDLALAVIRAFSDGGQALAAVEWFARYARRFEETFEEPPQPALAARVEQLRAAARRAIAPAPPAHKSTDSFRDASSTGSSVRSHRLPPRSRAAILGMLGVVCALGGAIWLSVSDTAEAEPRGQTTMLISMINRTPDVGWRHFAQSLEETLAARMANPPRLYVAIRPARIGRGQATRSITEPTPRPTPEHADFILAGSVHQTAERVRIDLRVFEGASNRAIRTVRISRSRRDVFALLDETAEELADTLRPLLGSAIGARVARSRTTSTAAWGDLEYSKALLADARRFAVRGGGAQAAALLELADSLARRAAHADPRWIDAWLQSAQIERGRSFARLTNAPPDLPAASKYLVDAVGILSNAASRWPDEVRVHELAGTVSYERWVLARPRGEVPHLLDEAVRSLERAVLLDPYAARPWVTLSDVYGAKGEYAASAVAAQRALERDAFAEYTDELHNRLFHAHFELHRDQEAARWCDEINRRGPGRALGAFCELNLQGWSSIREPNLAAADSLIENLDADPPAFVAMMRPRLRMLEAAVAARQGDTEAARRLLDDAIAAARRTGDAEAGSFHAAALVRLGKLDAARRVLADYSRSGGDRVHVERWFHELVGKERAEP